MFPTQPRRENVSIITKTEPRKHDPAVNRGAACLPLVNGPMDYSVFCFIPDSLGVARRVREGSGSGMAAACNDTWTDRVTRSFRRSPHVAHPHRRRSSVPWKCRLTNAGTPVLWRDSTLFNFSVTEILRKLNKEILGVEEETFPMWRWRDRCQGWTTWLKRWTRQCWKFVRYSARNERTYIFLLLETWFLSKN